MNVQSLSWTGVLVVLLPVALSLRFMVYRKETGGSPAKPTAASSDLASLKLRYLVVFLLVKLADWLQGPYFYQLYTEKVDSRTGVLFTPGAISSLFVVGFVASVLTSMLTGGLIDAYGRKLGCLVCAAVYTVDCLLVHADSYGALWLGRVCAGVASALLHSVFEAWFLGETAGKDLPDGWIGSVMSLQWFLDGVVAVTAGIVAQYVANSGGTTAVFDLSAVLLVGVFVLVAVLWGENTGSSTSQSQTKDALLAIVGDVRLLVVGLVQALFGGAMYSFVLVWVPVLKNASSLSGTDAPLGIVFSAFMVCIMVGSSAFTLLGLSPGTLMAWLLAASTVALALPALFPTSILCVGVGFLLFETCCGMYFPASGCIRSQVVPSALATSVLSLYRVPLNMFVVTLLVNLDAIGSETALLVCSGSLALATVMQLYLNLAASSKPKAE